MGFKKVLTAANINLLSNLDEKAGSFTSLIGISGSALVFHTTNFFSKTTIMKLIINFIY